MAAAILHNLSLKRAVLGPGILTCLLSLAKGAYKHTCYKPTLSTHPINKRAYSPVCCRWRKVPTNTHATPYIHAITHPCC